jgi:Inhibitor of vertebrate lysozyme (Ivy)
METLSIGNKLFTRGWICKPHDCNRNQLAFLVALDGSRAVGFLRHRIESMRRGIESVWIGRPSEEEKELLVQTIRQ